MLGAFLPFFSETEIDELASEGKQDEAADVVEDTRKSPFKGRAELLLDLLPRDDGADAFFTRVLFEENNPFPGARSLDKDRG